MTVNDAVAKRVSDLLKANNMSQYRLEQETGIQHVHPVTGDIYSLEILTVDGHVKKGKYVSSHLHLNVTYLLEANDEDFIKNKEDENSSVTWIPIDNLDNLVEENHMKVIYQKIIDKYIKNS